MPPTPSNGPNVSEKTEVHFCEGGLHLSQAVLLNFTIFHSKSVSE